MWKVSKKLFLITTLPLVIVGIGFLFLAITTPPEVLSDDGFPLNTIYYFMALSFMIFPLIGSMGVYYFYKRINDRETYLLQKGIQGHAEILERNQTGTYLNEQPEVKFLLLVTIPDQEPYQIEHKEIVNLLDVGNITVGKKIPIVVDPNDSKNMLLLYG